MFFTARTVLIWSIATIITMACAGGILMESRGIAADLHRRGEILNLDRFGTRLRSIGQSSTAVFTPTVDVKGAANCTGATPAGATNAWCHELDTYTLDGTGKRHFQAFYFDSAAKTVQEYTYADPQLFRGAAPIGVTAVGDPISVTFFQVRAIPIGDGRLRTDPGVPAPLIALLNATPGLEASFANYTAKTAFTGVTISNSVYHVEFGNSWWNRSVDVAVGVFPLVAQSVISGTYHPTPAPGMAGGIGGGAFVLFPYPGANYAVDAADTHVSPSVPINEAAYHDFYVGAFPSACGVASFPVPQPAAGSTYTGSYRDPSHPTPPSPPAGTPAVFPIPNTDANQTGAATLTLASTASTSGGQCSGVARDVYHQTRPANVDVMAAVATSSASVSWAAADSSTKTVSIFKLWDANTLNPSVVGNTCAGIANGAFGAPTTPGAPDGATPAARPFAITPVTVAGSNVGGSCAFTIASQYAGEPTVQVAVNVTPGAPPSGPLATRPFAIEFPPSGGQVASLNRMVNLPLAMIGGPHSVQIALAGYPNCGVGIARAFIDNFTTPDVGDALIGTDGGGCMNGGGMTAVQQTGSARLFNDLDTCRPYLAFGAMSNGNAGPGWDSFSVAPIAQTPLCQYKTYSDLNPLSGVGAQSPKIVYARVGASGAISNAVTNDQSYTQAGGCDPSGTFSPDVTQTYTYGATGPIVLTDTGDPNFQTVTGTAPGGSGHVHESSNNFSVIWGLKGGTCTAKSQIVKYHWDWYFDVGPDGSIMLTSTSQGNGL